MRRIVAAALSFRFFSAMIVSGPVCVAAIWSWPDWIACASVSPSASLP